MASTMRAVPCVSTSRSMSTPSTCSGRQVTIGVDDEEVESSVESSSTLSIDDDDDSADDDTAAAADDVVVADFDAYSIVPPK